MKKSMLFILLGFLLNAYILAKNDNPYDFPIIGMTVYNHTTNSKICLIPNGIGEDKADSPSWYGVISAKTDTDQDKCIDAGGQKEFTADRRYINKNGWSTAGYFARYGGGNIAAFQVYFRKQPMLGIFPSEGQFNTAKNCIKDGKSWDVLSYGAKALDDKYAVVGWGLECNFNNKSQTYAVWAGLEISDKPKN